MNIFYLHHLQRKCARWYVDRHVIKMILETCQLLCTAIWLSGGEAYCKPTHQNHPCSIWTRASKQNWKWLRRLGIALCKEYTFRYNKTHKLESVIRNLSVPNLPDLEFQCPPCAMPDQYKIENNVIMSYRNYYCKGKAHLHFWKNQKPAFKNRKIPKFIREYYSLNSQEDSPPP